MKAISETKINKTYALLKEYYEKHLRQHGVTLPHLKNSSGLYTKDALVLIYLAQGYPNTASVSKNELTQFVRKYYPDTTDVQQARHLAAQKGWFIVSGTRGNGYAHLDSGEYKLISLENPYPSFTGERRVTIDSGSWEELMTRYGHRCATCGSIEGEPNIHWPNSITELQKSHKDPNKPLNLDNAIPQCQFCNRAYRNDWVFDEKGRVRQLSNPKAIKRSYKSVRLEVFKILFKEFFGRDPDEK